MGLSLEILYKGCSSNNVVKNGRSKSGEQRLVCKDCKKTMQLEYRRNGDNPEIKARILKMAHNGNGIRQTSRILEISTSTVMKNLKKLPIVK